MVCEVLATVVGVVLQSFVIAELGPDMGDQDGCVLGGGIEIPEPEPEGGSLTRREQMQLAFFYGALAVSVIMVVTSLITAIWVPERPQFTRRSVLFLLPTSSPCPTSLPLLRVALNEACAFIGASWPLFASGVLQDLVGGEVDQEGEGGCGVLCQRRRSRWVLDVERRRREGYVIVAAYQPTLTLYATRALNPGCFCLAHLVGGVTHTHNRRARTVACQPGGGESGGATTEHQCYVNRLDARVY